MDQEEMKNRTKEYAKKIISLCQQIPNTREGRLIGTQLFRSGTSVGANYRSARRGRSKAEFISKLGLVLEEADESPYCLEILAESKTAKSSPVPELIKESSELIAIFVSSLNTAKRK